VVTPARLRHGLLALRRAERSRQLDLAFRVAVEERRVPDKLAVAIAGD
jgi:hypothetical protein